MIFGVIGSVGLVLLRRVLGLLGIGPAADAKDVEITVLRRRRHPSNPHAGASAEGERLCRTLGPHRPNRMPGLAADPQGEARRMWVGEGSWYGGVVPFGRLSHGYPQRPSGIRIVFAGFR